MEPARRKRNIKIKLMRDRVTAARSWAIVCRPHLCGDVSACGIAAFCRQLRGLAPWAAF
jgi:hypothetical protein